MFQRDPHDSYTSLQNLYKSPCYIGELEGRGKAHNLFLLINNGPHIK